MRGGEGDDDDDDVSASSGEAGVEVKVTADRGKQIASFDDSQTLAELDVSAPQREGGDKKSSRQGGAGHNGGNKRGQTSKRTLERKRSSGNAHGGTNHGGRSNATAPKLPASGLFDARGYCKRHPSVQSADEGAERRSVGGPPRTLSRVQEGEEEGWRRRRRR